MGTIKEVQQLYERFFNGFNDAVLDAMEDSAPVVVGTIHEQLASGLNGDERPLRPTYTDDPWFQSEAAGTWKGKGLQYMKWKAKITPPARSWLGFPERDKNTPNLYIVGMFYASIKAKRMSSGLQIESDTPLGHDIEGKYGSVILKPSSTSKNYLVRYHIQPSLVDYFKKCRVL